MDTTEAPDTMAVAGGPPPEALAACEGKSNGDACSMPRSDSSVDGTCQASPNGGDLGCRPAGPPPGQERR